MYKKILVPLDGSELAEAVLPHVRALALSGGAEIVLLRVADRPIYNALFPQPAVAFSLYERAEIEAQIYLEDIAAQLRLDGLPVTADVCNGLVADAILDYAAVMHADLIAMSTHGRSGIQRWVIGSVADKVVRGASVPVLLVRPVPVVSPAAGPSAAA